MRRFLDSDLIKAVDEAVANTSELSRRQRRRIKKMAKTRRGQARIKRHLVDPENAIKEMESRYGSTPPSGLRSKAFIESAQLKGDVLASASQVMSGDYEACFVVCLDDEPIEVVGDGDDPFDPWKQFFTQLVDFIAFIIPLIIQAIDLLGPLLDLFAVGVACFCLAPTTATAQQLQCYRVDGVKVCTPVARPIPLRHFRAIREARKKRQRIQLGAG